MALLFRIIVTLLALTFGVCFSAKIQFYDGKNFTGLLQEIESSTLTGCKDMSKYNRMTTSINTNGECLLLYSKATCGLFSSTEAPSYSVKVVTTPDLSTVDFDKMTVSYQLCSEAEGGDQLNVDLYSERNYKETSAIGSYQAVCDCVDLPSFAASNVSSVANHGNCVKLYKERGCTGESYSLRAGLSPESEDLGIMVGGFDKSVVSLGPCDGDVKPSCWKLSASLFKAEVSYPGDLKKHMEEEETPVTSERIRLTLPTLFSNDAESSTMNQEYSAKATIHESVKIAKCPGLEGLELSVEDDFFTVSTDQVQGIGLLGKQSLQGIIRAAYESTTSSNGLHVEQQSREVAVLQQVSIPPCTQYKVDSYVTLTHDHPMDYAVYSKISGEFGGGGRRMSSEEITSRLLRMGMKDMELVSELDDHTVVAKAKGGLKVSFVQEVKVDGDESAIGGCTPREAEVDSSNSERMHLYDNDYTNGDGVYYSRQGSLAIAALIILTGMGVIFICFQLHGIFSFLKKSEYYSHEERPVEVRNPVMFTTSSGSSGYSNFK